ncbi:MAG: efflux RND transporter periplasmic adaptor subunit [Verrucomicrobiaceae bacterium]|nr:efflux RND transporter periplasmic adaptor subunit [Verrucomicrobiaceae bacterium]
MAALIAIYLFFGRGTAAVKEVPVFTAQKGPLQISVLQGGEIRALQNLEIKSEIETPTKILSIIPEGYVVTEEDVKDGKVLVELDNSDIKQRIVDHEIQFQTTVAAYIEADEQRDIQRSDNLSMFRETKEAALFALMDFEKYLGKQAAAGILKSAGLPESVNAFDAFITATEAASNAPVLRSLDGRDKSKSPAGGDAAAKPAPKKSAGHERVNFISFLKEDALEDGDAQQKLRQLGDELLLHKAEVAVAEQTYESSARLEAKKFITATALKNDEVNLEKAKLAVKTAETSLDLFKKYEFPKECETRLGNYREVLDKVERTVRSNRARMAQSESKFSTAKRRYEVELEKKEDLERQLKACVIKATQPGIVAYGDLNASASARYNESIEEGSSVRLRQTILTIPDMSQMGAHVNVHESQVKKVKLGQRVLVRVDAEPGKVLDAQVAELALLPDSTSTRYTPNVKVYPCTIHIQGTHDWLKPGMNAKVDIIVDDLDDVLFVPVQSIEVENDHHFCYVSTGSKLERREITTGLFNDEFIEVRSGLDVGEAVALALPQKSMLDEQQQPKAAEHEQPAHRVARTTPEAAAAGKNIARR